MGSNNGPSGRHLMVAYLTAWEDLCLLLWSFVARWEVGKVGKVGKHLGSRQDRDRNFEPKFVRSLANKEMVIEKNRSLSLVLHIYNIIVV